MYFDVLLNDQHNQTGKLTLASSAKESGDHFFFFFCKVFSGKRQSACVLMRHQIEQKLKII